jgi:hypothetical protein
MIRNFNGRQPSRSGPIKPEKGKSMSGVLSVSWAVWEGLMSDYR